MLTRAPLPSSSAFDDKPKMLESSCEPISVQIRKLPGERNFKIIWWFITGVLDDQASKESGTLLQYENYESIFLSAPEAIKRLTFEKDREIVELAWHYASETEWARAANG
jgi:hypothetical protein